MVKNAPSSATPPDVAARLEELTRTVASFAQRFDTLEGLLKETKQENTVLKQTLEDRDRELFKLRDRLNDLEQYGRGWSVRILGLPIPEEEASSPELVMQHVYNKALLPILQGAREKGTLATIPTAEELLETAHILPAKPDTINPIIARFYTRNLRNLVLRLKRDHAPRLPVEQGRSRSAPQRPGKFAYPIYEDLTRINFQKMRALAQHELVESCWSINGALRFKMKDDDTNTIRRVKSVFMSVEEIIK